MSTTELSTLEQNLEFDFESIHYVTQEMTYQEANDYVRSYVTNLMKDIDFGNSGNKSTRLRLNIVERISLLLEEKKDSENTYL